MIRYCSLASGSSGNVHLVMSETTKILIDVGKTRKYIVSALESLQMSMQDIDAIILTHEHRDHIAGLKVLSKRYTFELYTFRENFEMFKEDVFLPKEHIHFIQGKFMVGDLEIDPFCVAHDAVATHGYIITQGNQSVGIATDIGILEKHLAPILERCQLIALEANHDINLVRMGNYPYRLKERILSERGHLCNSDCAQLIVEIYYRSKKLKHVLLSHLSGENNHPELALLTIQKELERCKIYNQDIHISVSKRDEVGPIYEIL